MTSLNTILQQLETALKNKASYETLIGLFRQIKSGMEIEASILPKFFEIMYQYLHYQGEREIYPGYTVGAHIRACAFGEIEAALLEKSRSSFLKIDWDIDKAKQNLKPFFEYLMQFESNYYLDWKIFTDGYPVIKEVFEIWLKEMENKGKKPKGYVDGLKKAVELNNYEEKIKKGEINWVNAKDFLMPLLDDPHFMVRAGAAKCIGLFYPNHTKNYPEGIPSFLKTLELMGKKEIEKAGVLGPFIDGYDGDCAGIYSLKWNEEIEAATFDISEWILKILEQSGQEPGAPNAQSLDFYVHEYFESDPASIKKLIKMGREELAFEAATNLDKKIEGMQEVLQLLAKSENKRIAISAAEHLKRYYK